MKCLNSIYKPMLATNVSKYDLVIRNYAALHMLLCLSGA